MGAGGVGGYFGAKLAADGNDVTFIARGAHLAAMRESGLRVLSETGDLHIEAPQVVEDPSESGLFDLVLFCVKLWDSEPAARLIQPQLAADAAVVPLQNGVAAVGLLSDVLGPQFVLPGLARIASAIEAPGVIRHNGAFAEIVFGELDGSESWRQDTLLAACDAAGFTGKISKNIQRDLWHKLTLLAPMAGACTMNRATLGTVRDDAAMRGQLVGMVEEAAAVGRASGLDLRDDLAQRTLAAIETFPETMKPSMLHDLESGKRLEVDWLNGALVRLGGEHGVATPEHQRVVEALEGIKLGQAG